MIGKKILHYTILEKLGQGGMGAVYKAEDTKLRRVVALKFLPPQALADEDDKARFVHEAQAAAALQHPNICTVYEINETDDQIFISMAYLQGGSLKDRIERGALKTRETLEIAMQVARGLEAAHEKHIVHRDIKPTNIMFSENGVATVMDFGLAKSKHQTHVTRMGTTMGTIAYMSPEQTRGVDVDHRTDIWSLGVMLYEMASGQRPFRGDYDEAVIYSILNEAPRPVEEAGKDVDPNLAYIIGKAMAKNPADRYQTCGEMLEDLEAALDAVKAGSSKTKSFTRVGPAGRPTGVRRLMTARVILPAVLALVVAAAVLVVMQTGDRGGVTETVAVVDETGRRVERVVPKSEFRRSFAVYPFDTKSGETEHAWLGMAVPLLLETDLMQDQFLTIRSAFDATAFAKLQRAGFTRWDDAPWAIKRDLAVKSNLDYLVTGSVSVEDGVYEVNKLVHDASTGRLVATKTYRGRNLFTLADSVATDLKGDLSVPRIDSEAMADLPVAEITTSSPDALKAMALGSARTAFDQDFSEAIELFEEAARIDSTAAMAYFSLLELYINENRGERIDWALEGLMRHLYKLPERLQFIGKHAYYLLRKEPDKSFAVLEMAIDLYPGDVMSRQTLAIQYSARNRFDEAIALYEEILEIDPSHTEVLQNIGGLYRAKGDFARALEYYEAYAEKHPKNFNSFTEIAAVYEIQGDFDRAMEYYDRALLIEPENVGVLAAEGTIHLRMGRWEAALERYGRALSLSRSSQDRIEVIDALQEYYLWRGELQSSFEQMRLKWTEVEKTGTAVQFMMTRLIDAHLLIKAGREDEAFDIIESIGRAMGPPYDGLVPVGYVYAYLELEEADSAETALERLMPFVEAYQIEQLRQNIAYAKGRIAEIRGDYAEAVRWYEEQARLLPTSARVNLFIGRCQRKLREYQKAETSLLKALNLMPSHPEVLYEYALLQADMGAKDKAVETLRKSLSVWENADPAYEPARKARETLSEWATQAS